MEKKLTKEEGQEIADLITPIINEVDRIQFAVDVEKMKQFHKSLIDDVNTRETLSVITGHMNNSDKVSLIADTFGAIIKLIEARIEQRKLCLSQINDPRKELDEKLNGIFS